MKKLIIITAAILAILALAGFVCWRNMQPTTPLAGTWMLYEGGYVAPEVLTFNANGSGVAYDLSDAYQDHGMTDVHIPRSCLEHAEIFQWSIENGMLTFSYESGKQDSLRVSFDEAFAVPILSLQENGGSGGWIPAEIID